MDEIVIAGVPPWDGRYPLDLDQNPFTYREWGYLKRFSGYLPLTIRAGVEGSDPALFAALALTALRRAGRISEQELPQVHESLLDAPFDLEQGTTIRLELDTTADADGEGELDPTASSNGSSSSSGERSSRSSLPAGIHGSATSESPPPA